MRDDQLRHWIGCKLNSDLRVATPRTSPKRQMREWAEFWHGSALSDDMNVVMIWRRQLRMMGIEAEAEQILRVWQQLQEEYATRGYA